MANAQVSQSAIEIVALANPFAKVSQSAIEIITIPAVVGVQIIFRGVKRLQDGGAQPLQEIQEAAHVKKAV